MAGSVRERRPGVWELRVYIGRDVGGRFRHRQVTVEGTKREQLSGPADAQVVVDAHIVGR
ncbi:MAG: hypothetical protein ACRDWV_09655 [Acidimicrobiales bacterium]